MLSPACSIEASLLRGGALVGRRERVGDHLALDVLTSARRGDSSCDATLHTPLVGALAIGFPASTRLSVGRSFCSHSSLTKSIFFSSRSERRGCSGSAAAANFFCRLTSPSYRVRSFLDPTRSPAFARAARPPRPPTPLQSAASAPSCSARLQARCTEQNDAFINCRREISSRIRLTRSGRRASDKIRKGSNGVCNR